jgi:putative pyruvate formate lyase activating enzyme
MAARTIPRQFFLPSSEFTPAYLRLGLTELRRRAEAALDLLRDCVACPRDCHVNRWEDRIGVCRTGRYAIVSSFFPHFGEEDCLRGWNGSGTIFFSMCNLRCAFCQNYDISQLGHGRVVTPQQLAAMMLHLQDVGCHNINFVTPEHVVPQILEALPLAVEGGLRLPIVYNTSSYDSMHSLQLLDGVVDIYMPDFKFWDPQMSRLYMKAPDYPEVARRVIAEMHRQVGELKLDEFGLARRGVLIRHLVMPGGIAGTREIMTWIARELSVHSYVNLMDQYHPAGLVGSNPRYDAINRRITPDEFAQAVAAAREAGLYRLDVRLRRHPLLRWSVEPAAGPADRVRVQ